MHIATLAFVVLVAAAAQVLAARPPGLPKPQTSTHAMSTDKAALRSCYSKVLKGKSKSLIATQTFVSCYNDSLSWFNGDVASFLKTLNQCTRPGDYDSRSPLYTAMETCVLARAG